MAGFILPKTFRNISGHQGGVSHGADVRFDKALSASSLYTQKLPSIVHKVTDRLPGLGFTAGASARKFNKEAERSAEFSRNYVSMYGEQRAGTLSLNHMQVLDGIKHRVGSNEISPREGLSLISNFHKDYKAYYKNIALTSGQDSSIKQNTINPAYEEKSPVIGIPKVQVEKQGSSDAHAPVLEWPEFGENFGNSFISSAPTENWLPKANHGTTYRVDSRPYNVIFKEGFQPRQRLENPTLNDLKQHVIKNKEEGHNNFVSTTTDENTAREKYFFTDDFDGDPTIDHQYFVLKNVEGWDSKDFPDISDKKRYNNLSYEKEVMSDGVPGRNVEKVVVRYADGSEKEIKNPHFKRD